MKDKIKRFFVEKKELLIFVGILTLVFGAVIAIANITLKSDKDNNVVAITDNDDDDNAGTTEPDVITPEVTEPEVADTFSKPVLDGAVILRCYYDTDKDSASLETAVIVSGNNFYESTGVTYANQDDSLISVYAIFDGVVLSVEKDDVHGNIVSINHGSEIVSYYSSLTTVEVEVGDTIKKGDCIGTGGINAYDPEASNHVTLEVKVQGIYVDPEEVFSKEVSFVSSLVNEGK